MKDKDTQLIYEAYGPDRWEDRAYKAGKEFKGPMFASGDEHNPPDDPGPLSSDVYDAMDKQEGLSYIMSKYEGMGDLELQSHLYVLNELIEMSPEERVVATGEDSG